MSNQFFGPVTFALCYISLLKWLLYKIVLFGSCSIYGKTVLPRFRSGHLSLNKLLNERDTGACFTAFAMTAGVTASHYILPVINYIFFAIVFNSNLFINILK
jgi:hypothetical protein